MYQPLWRRVARALAQVLACLAHWDAGPAGGGAHAEFVSGLLDRMTADAETSIGGNAPYRDDTNDDNRAALPVQVPGLSQTVATPHNGSARKAALPASACGRKRSVWGFCGQGHLGLGDG